MLVEFNYEDLEVNFAASSNLWVELSCMHLRAGLVSAASVQRGGNDVIHSWARGGKGLCIKKGLPLQGRQVCRRCHLKGLWVFSALKIY